MEGRSSEYKKGLWTVEEDKILTDYIRLHGKGKWNRVAKVTGLKRCGKSCRLRWINYLSPNVKRGNFSQEEDDLIIRLHNLLGNRWSLIAGRVPGRTDNQVKNHWNTHLGKKVGARRKGKGKVVDSTQALSKSVGGNLSTLSKSDFTPSLSGNEEGTRSQEVNKIGFEHQSIVGLSGSQELMKGDIDYDNCFWFSSDELDLQPHSLMEFLDKSLDFIWHGL
ncbi:hypothetical protein Dsin_004888 [Dipteronia sinensis]|uniref:Transcription factor WER-like n=1 Tax=Dipteronia sinensis TaxID=43782 RepID=A0AAE0AVE1_9ROSI|nr:hypothetical protein Dsin_004888 [Dipteronia sinensis]